MLKPWILHIILAWQVTIVSPEEQKTLMLQFDSEAECVSVAGQVDSQVKQYKSIFRIKSINCYACTDLFDKGRCPAVKAAPPKAKQPKVSGKGWEAVPKLAQ